MLWRIKFESVKQLHAHFRTKKKKFKKKKIIMFVIKIIRQKRKKEANGREVYVCVFWFFLSSEKCG